MTAELTMLTRAYNCAEPQPPVAGWESITGHGANGRPFASGERTEPNPGEISPVDPLYLFGCGLRWHRERDTSAGWELIHSLQSADGEGRTVAAELLAKTEHSRLLVRDLRRAKARLSRSLTNRALNRDRKPPGKVSAMNTPYGLNIIDSCVTCSLRKNQWFCGLSPEALKVLALVSRPAIYPGAALLFVEGQSPRGAYVLCSGKAKLSTTSRDGKVLILKIAGEGEVLGLSAAISGSPSK